MAHTEGGMQEIRPPSRNTSHYTVKRENSVVPVRRSTSNLGEAPVRRTSSFLKRLDIIPFVESKRTEEDQVPRSPVGAVRHPSGLTLRPKPGAAVHPPFEEKEKEEGVAWHLLPIDEVYRLLETRFGGLTSAEQQVLLAKHGPNEITPPKTMHWFIKFLLSLVEGFQAMMNVGAIMCIIVFLISGLTDRQTLVLGIMLFVTAFLSSVFTSYQEGKADKIMEELRALAADGVWAFRDGELKYVAAKEIVPGDIVKVTSGEKVPADLRVISSTDLKVNNSSLTGENVDIKLGPDALHTQLYEAKNVARSGCNFTSGNGIGIVFATGDNTFFGGIARSTTVIDRPETLMKREVRRLILMLGIFAILIGIAFLIIALVVGFTWIEAVAFCIGIIVANVPEGLLSQLVVSLAIVAKKLKKKNVLVTNLEIIETLGAVTIICSDKTGTLTCNRMTVAHVVLDGKIYHTAQLDDSECELVDPSHPCMQELKMNIALNSEAIFIKKTPPDDVLKWETKGDASESALIKFVQPLQDVAEYRKANPRRCCIPFNSSNKWMLSVHELEDKTKPIMVLVKGAPERVLGMCTSAHKGGKVVQMTPQVLEEFESLNTQLGKKGERVLAFAYLALPRSQYGQPSFVFDADTEPPNFPTSGLTLVGFTSLVDPPRPTVKTAMEACSAAGVRVYMVTGDHPVTALAISHNIGIVKHMTAIEMQEQGMAVPPDYRGAVVVHGTEMAKFTQEDWDFILSHEDIVFARTMPQQKQEIVTQLHKLGHVVAMTGDGVNDAPALKAANVGVAMGSGASVAKEAAQIIVMNDDFSSIVEGIRGGRLVFASMKKLIVYVLISNVPELIPFLAFVALNIPLAMEILIILTIDVGTDVMPGIAMAYEEDEAKTMEVPPRKPEDHLITIRLMVVSYCIGGVIETIAGYFGFFYVLRDRGFSWSDIFGAGLQFRDDYTDLKGSRIHKMEELCLSNTKFDRSIYNCTTDWQIYRKETLGQAQSAFYAGIIWSQMINIMVRKTNYESIFNVRRLTRNRLILCGLVFEVCMLCLIVYCPGVNEIFLVRPISAKHLFCSLWVMPAFLLYEEARKFFVRRDPDGCVAALTNL